jgi:hypothetical protein
MSAVVFVEIPPLRERGNDVLVLARQFLRHYAEGHRLTPTHLSQTATAWLRRYPWPGNVRELSHLMERVMLLHRGTSVDEAALERLCLPRGQPTVHAVVESARDEQEPEDESAKIRQALRWTEGNVAQAARLLGWSRKALRYRIDRYGIERPSREVAIPLLRRRPASTAPRPLLPNKGQAEEAVEPQGVNMKRSDQAIPQVEGPSWEQKPVAVLAIEIIWPVVTGSEALRYEPWTLATRWEQRIVKKVQGFGGIVLQRAPSLYLVAFGLPQTLEGARMEHGAPPTARSPRDKSPGSAQVAIHPGFAVHGEICAILVIEVGIDDD